MDQINHLNLEQEIGLKQMMKQGVHTHNKQIKFKTSMLRSSLCDYSDAYILVKGNITVNNNTAAAAAAASNTNKKVIFKKLHKYNK